MDKLAKKILKLAEPTLEKMLDDGISEKELSAAEAMVGIARDLVEYDVMMAKLGKGESSYKILDSNPGEHQDEGMGRHKSDHANDELLGAQEYIKMYADTGDKDYLTMSHDETTHAEKFIRVMPDGEMKREYMERYNQIVERIRAYSAAM